ncbi:MAG: c-type cytochrome [Bacteroidetes bacterium]|jgi:cytochrome c oxidase subunit II|nr:c-type cytochrome [Bacteroidota bacterium]
MSNKFKQQTKWLFLVLGLLFVQHSFAYKSTLTRQIAGEDGTDARIEEGSKLFAANCASCHKLKGKLVGPGLEGVVDKYEEDWTWLNAWIKNNQKLIKSGDERANAIYTEYNKSAMNIFENLSDKQITSILMWIDNGGDGPSEGGGGPIDTLEPPEVPNSLFNNINWAVVVMCLLVFVILLMLFGILELVSNVTGKEIINWNNINAYMMLVFLVGFFGLVLYEYSVHKDFLLPQSASEHGVDMDRMMQWTFAATLPVFFITQFLLFFFSFKYRQKPGRKAYFLSHNNNLELVWTIIPAIVLAILVSGGFKMWNKILRSDAGKDALQIEVFAYQFGWNARYPGEDNKLGKANYNLINGVNPLGVANREHATGLITELEEEIVSLNEAISRLPQEEAKLRSTLGGLVGDDRDAHLREIHSYESGDVLNDLKLTIRARNTQIERLKGALAAAKGSMFTGEGDDDRVVQEIHLVKDQPITLKFRARDVIHSAYLPYFRAQMNVVPGLPTEFTFKPILSTGDMREIKGDPEFDYYLVCNKICGNAHFNMKMKVVVEENQAAYDKWMNEQAALFVKKEETKNAETESTEEGTETVASN